MSSPHVIVSAVHELDDEEARDFWRDENVREVVDNFDKEVWDDEWYMSSAQFRSQTALKIFDINTTYHSNRDSDVAEIVLDGEEHMKDIGISGLEEIIREINDRFERDFTLEVYYWYDGVDKPGGC